MVSTNLHTCRTTSNADLIWNDLKHKHSPSSHEYYQTRSWFKRWGISLMGRSNDHKNRTWIRLTWNEWVNVEMVQLRWISWHSFLNHWSISSFTIRIRSDVSNIFMSSFERILAHNFKRQSVRLNQVHGIFISFIAISLREGSSLISCTKFMKRTFLRNLHLRCKGIHRRRLRRVSLNRSQPSTKKNRSKYSSVRTKDPLSRKWFF